MIQKSIYLPCWLTILFCMSCDAPNIRGFFPGVMIQNLHNTIPDDVNKIKSINLSYKELLQRDKIRSILNYEYGKNNNNQGEISSTYSHLTINYLYLIVSLLVILIVAVILFWRFRRMKNKLIEMEMNGRELEDKMQDYEEMREKRQELLHEKLEISKKIMLLKSRNNLDERTYSKINKIVYGEEREYFDWNEFYHLLNERYDNYLKKIKKLYPQCSESEMHLCALMKADFNSSETSFILNIFLNTVRMKKTMIRKKVGITDGGKIIPYLDRVIESKSKEGYFTNL